MAKLLAILGGAKAVPDGVLKRWPPITQADRDALVGVLDSGLSSAETPNIDACQREWAYYVGAKHVLMTNSGTAALHMGVAATGIGPGDEVIVPAFTFLASASCVLHHNAIPVFVDIEYETGNIDVAKVESKITERTRGIIPVHMNGMPCEIDRVGEIARRHNLVVIEDACQAHGATFKGRRVGTFGDVAAFSLNYWKNLTGIEGGFFVTDDDEFAAKAQMVREFGETVHRGQRRAYDSHTMGWMYRSTEFSAAFVRSQLARLDQMNGQRLDNARKLNRELSPIPGVTVTRETDDRQGVYWFYPIWLDPGEAGLDVEPACMRRAVERALWAEGLRAGPWQTVPVPSQTLFREQVGYGKGCPWTCSHYTGDVRYAEERYPEAERFIDHVMWLATGYAPPNTEKEMDIIIAAFHKVFNQLDEVVDYHVKNPPQEG
ncbi:MAG: DegT/DnrJ/EryC1/StrS family aminotransferase [Desulfobacteraceae bacterium]|nr:DegT/DnrJ/EryC1/StrS family aminotransferase [Desulfobacteraceae bacterium]